VDEGDDQLVNEARLGESWLVWKEKTRLGMFSAGFLSLKADT
jgi:hypothetical protein